MRIQIRNDYDFDFTIREDDRMDQAAHAFVDPNNTCVLGVLRDKEQTLFVVCENNSNQLLSLVSARYFDVVDRNVPAGWQVFLGIRNEHAIHHDFDFSCFDYIGVPKIFGDPKFYSDYHHDYLDAIAYVSEAIEQNLKEVKWQPTA